MVPIRRFACTALVALAPVTGLGADPASAEMPGRGKQAVLEVKDHGEIRFEFLPLKAPGHVKNFIELAEKGFYDGTTFHRVIPGFMIQGGCPNTKNDNPNDDGTGGPGYTIDAEFNDVHHERGVVSMARSQNPNSAGSQFFIVHQAAAHLDGQYTAFGRVTKGMEVVDKIVEADRDRRDRPLEKVVVEKVTIVDAAK